MNEAENNFLPQKGGLSGKVHSPPCRLWRLPCRSAGEKVFSLSVCLLGLAQARRFIRGGGVDSGTLVWI